MFLACWLHGCGGGVIKKLLHAEVPPVPSLLMLLSGSISGAHCEKKNNMPLFSVQNTLECAHVGKVCTPGPTPLVSIMRSCV